MTLLAAKSRSGNHSWKKLVVFAVSFGSIFAAASASAAEQKDSGYRIQIHVRYVAGDKLRLLIETYRSPTPASGQGDDLDSFAGYLVEVNLFQPGEMTARSRVIGPLWRLKGGQSNISFTSGALFTKEDRQTAGQRPRIWLEDAGFLVRNTRKGVLDELLLDEKPRWAERGKYSAVRSLHWTSPARVQTNSARYLLQQSDGKSSLYDLRSGEQSSDAWLEKVFDEYLANESCGNSEVVLTDDLRYLVVLPEPIYLKRGTKGEKDRRYEQFQFEGREYSRKDFSLLYQRDHQARVFRRPELAGKLKGVMSVGGELLLRFLDQGAVRLATPEGAVRFETAVDYSPPLFSPFFEFQLDEPQSRVVFYDEASRLGIDGEEPQLMRGRLTVWVWNYQRGELKRDELDLGELFSLKDGAYSPKQPIGIAGD